VYALVNEANIISLTKELLDYLQIADAEFKPDLTAKICALVQRFAPNKRWHFDSLMQARMPSNAPSATRRLQPLLGRSIDLPPL
jgi:AP-1 complex subunit gamma-1